LKTTGISNESLCLLVVQLGVVPSPVDDVPPHYMLHSCCLCRQCWSKYKFFSCRQSLVVMHAVKLTDGQFAFHPATYISKHDDVKFSMQAYNDDVITTLL